MADKELVNTTLSKVNSQSLARSPKQNKKLQTALRRKGINMETIADKIVELLNANWGAEQKAPDNIIRHRVLETLIRVLDANPPQKLEIDKTTTHQVVFTPEAVSRLEKYREMRQLTRDETTGIFTERPQE
jgi:hypothetical protein